MPIRAEGNNEASLPATLQSPKTIATSDIPQANLLVFAHAGEYSPIRSKGYGEYPVGIALQCFEAVTGADIP